MSQEVNNNDKETGHKKEKDKIDNKKWSVDVKSALVDHEIGRCIHNWLVRILHRFFLFYDFLNLRINKKSFFFLNQKLCAFIFRESKWTYVHVNSKGLFELSCDFKWECGEMFWRAWKFYSDSEFSVSLNIQMQICLINWAKREKQRTQQKWTYAMYLIKTYV